MKTALIVAAIWVAASIPVGVFVGKVIKAGRARVLPPVPPRPDKRIDSAPPK